MKLRIAQMLGNELHNLFTAQASAADRDPAKLQGEKALLALRETRTAGYEWVFESDDPIAIDVLIDHLRWIAQTADNVHRSTVAAARRLLARLESAAKERVA